MAQALIQIGKYRIERELGRGAMGIVYQAFDPVVERHVALKTIRFDESGGGTETLNLLKREAKSVGRFEHPNIITLYDAGEADGLFYMVMQLVQGETLRERIGRQRWYKVPQIVDIFRQILAGLGYAHEHGVIHRDIKPANIMITSEGVVKLADFGISKVIEPGVSLSGLVVGTPSYMSPEQVLGRAVDARSDLFSVGGTLYELVTGERAYPGDSATAVMYKIVHESPARPASMRPGIDPKLENVVLKALANDPDERFTTCKEMAFALEECLTTHVSGTLGARHSSPAAPVEAVVSPPRVPMTCRTLGRRRSGLSWPRWVTLGAGGTVASLVLAGIMVPGRRGGPSAPPLSALVTKSVQTQPAAAQITPPSPGASPEPAVRVENPIPSQLRARVPKRPEATRAAPQEAVARPNSRSSPPSAPSDAQEASGLQSLVVQGDVAFQQNAYEKALLAYSRAYQLKPGDPLLRRKIAVALTLLGRPMEAQKYR